MMGELMKAMSDLHFIKSTGFSVSTFNHCQMVGEWVKAISDLQLIKGR
jgi:hypothetical protein